MYSIAASICIHKTKLMLLEFSEVNCWYFAARHHINSLMMTQLLLMGLLFVFYCQSTFLRMWINYQNFMFDLFPFLKIFPPGKMLKAFFFKVRIYIKNIYSVCFFACYFSYHGVFSPVIIYCFCKRVCFLDRGFHLKLMPLCHSLQNLKWFHFYWWVYVLYFYQRHLLYSSLMLHHLYPYHWFSNRSPWTWKWFLFTMSIS